MYIVYLNMCTCICLYFIKTKQSLIITYTTKIKKKLKKNIFIVLYINVFKLIDFFSRLFIFVTLNIIIFIIKLLQHYKK